MQALRPGFDQPNSNEAAVRAAVADGKPVVYGAVPEQNVVSTLVGAHTYSVLGIASDGRFRVRNPWGVDGREPSGSTGDGELRLTWAQFHQSARFVWIAG